MAYQVPGASRPHSAVVLEDADVVWASLSGWSPSVVSKHERAGVCASERGSVYVMCDFPFLLISFLHVARLTIVKSSTLQSGPARPAELSTIMLPELLHPAESPFLVGIPPWLSL